MSEKKRALRGANLQRSRVPRITAKIRSSFSSCSAIELCSRQEVGISREDERVAPVRTSVRDDKTVLWNYLVVGLADRAALAALAKTRLEQRTRLRAACNATELERRRQEGIEGALRAVRGRSSGTPLNSLDYNRGQFA